MTEREFDILVRKANEPRIRKVKNAYDVRDYYRHFQKQHGRNILTEVEFGDILRAINESYVEDLNSDKFVVLPKRLGGMQVIYKATGVEEIDGEIKINRKQDWKSTLSLWYEDPEAYEKKIIIYREGKRIRKPVYYKHKHTFKNQIFFKFRFARSAAKLISLNELERQIKPLHYG